jgi:hypothetical protein
MQLPITLTSTVMHLAQLSPQLTPKEPVKIFSLFNLKRFLSACERSGNDYATASCETNITDFYQQNNNAAFVQLEWDVQTCAGTPSRIFTYRADYCALVSSNGPQYTMYVCNDTHVTLYNLCSDSACTVGCQVIASEIQPTCFQGVYQYCWAPNTPVLHI